MNRSLRRHMRRRAPDLARQYVETGGGILVAGERGGVARVEHPAAKNIVRKELERVLRDLGRPRLRRLDQDEVAAFPFMRPVPPDAEAWLGTGIDVDGRAAIVTRWLPAGSAGDGELAALWREALLAELVAECGRSGIPMPADVQGSA